MYNQSELKDLIDKAIIRLSCNGEAHRLFEPVRYILSIGGKRLRPVLALMACNIFTDKIDEAVLPATGIEIFHNFTLVHDDIMDKAPVRRNFPTVHIKWNVNQAILSGDVMAFIANECFLQAPPASLLKILRIYNKAAIDVCAGQQLDIDFEKATIISHEEYLTMIELKTARLLAASAKIGSVIGGAADRDTELMYEFGKSLGMAFQVQDDLLDTYGDTKVFGKVPGGDIIANKKTFLLVKALEIAAAPQLKTLQELFSGKEYEPEIKVQKVMDLYDQLNIRTITEDLATTYFNKAFSMLEKTGVAKDRKEELEMLAGSLIDRKK